jgi:hypothetical protein
MGVDQWHHNVIRFAPRGLELPPEMRRKREHPTEKIYPLLPEPYKTTDGKYVIRSYTKQAEFDEAHKKLDICTDTYWQDCRRGTSHIFAIESPDGELLSNIEIQLKPQGDTSVIGKTFIPIDGKNLTVMQHEGKKIQGHAEYIKSGPLHDALKELLTTIEAKRCPINLGTRGVTDESRLRSEDYSKNSSYRWFIEQAGYLPTPENVNRAFQEYKKEIRGGSIGQDENGRMVYPPDRPHFIEGSAKDAQGKDLAFRDMNSQEWMHASGILEFFAQRHWNQSIVKELAAKELKKPLSATLPAPLTNRQLAYAINSGTVPKREMHRLNEAERRNHAAHIRGEKDHSSFVR